MYFFRGGDRGRAADCGADAGLRHHLLLRLALLRVLAGGFGTALSALVLFQSVLVITDCLRVGLPRAFQRLPQLADTHLASGGGGGGKECVVAVAVCQM